MSKIANQPMRASIEASPGFFGRILEIADNAITSFNRVRRNRQVLTELASREDYLLRDIGLSRADIEQALASSANEDLSRMLHRARRRS